MGKTKKLFLSVVMGIVMLLSLCFGVVFAMPTRTAKAETLPTTGWTLTTEGDYEFRIQNGNTYWTTYTTNVTTASMLDYTEINGKTLTEINEENPGAVTVTLQPAGGTIGSFYRVSINSAVWDFTRHDIGTVKISAGWSHTDANGTYTIDTDLYFARKQNKASQSDQWKYIAKSDVVDISDDIVLLDQGIIAENTRSILLKTTGSYWTGSTPNENGGGFLNFYYVNGKSVRDWNKEAHAALDAGEITDITYGSGHGTISGNKGDYAPIFVWNAAYEAGVGGCYTQTWIPTGYISNVSSFKVAKGMGWLADDGKLYYVSKDVEYVKSGSSFVKVSSAVDISDAFKLLVQDYTSTNGTMLYYLHTNNIKYWTQQYGSTGGYAINEKEWKGVNDVSLQGGAVQMSYIEVNGESVYDINASDNGAYGATQGNIASGSKYAPILAFLTPEELGNAIKLHIPSAYPSGSGTAADNHKTITIKKGFYVVDTSTNIKYEVTKDIQWDYLDGAWGEHVNKIETNVTMAKMFGSASDAFAGIALEGSDYESAPSTYAGTAKTALEFAQSANFRSHILVDDVALPQPSEAYLNVWGNKGYFTFRTGNNTATKLTILAGCQFPTYGALLNGTKEVYVTTEDVTYVKSGDTWVKDEGSQNYTVTFTVDGETHATQEIVSGAYASVPAVPTKADSDKYTYTFNAWYLDGAAYDFSTPVTKNITLEANFTAKLKAGEYDISIETVTYARDNINNWMMFELSDKDYPNAGETYNVPTTEEQISALNLYDKIIVDGFKLSTRIAKHGNPVEAPKINLWVDDCFALRVAGAAGALDGAQKVVIQKGAQFPSYAYITEGIEAFYVTTETITFVNVGANSGVWERQYAATYVADEETVASVPYLVSQGIATEDIPEVPAKEGYSGKWETVDFNGNVTVNAIYTKVLGTTGIKELRNIDKNNAVFVILPTNHDYPADNNLGLDVSHLQKFNLLDYITINGKTLREIGVTEMAINKWTRPGLGLTTTLSNNMTIVIKEGCEIPSYAFWQNPNGETSCYTIDNDYTAVYSGEGELAFTITSAAKDPTGFEDNYVLSDLCQAGYGKTGVFQDGIETLVRTDGSEADYHYGYIDSNSFTLSFDFKYTDATWYESFAVMFGTDGYNSVKACFGWRFFLLRGNDTDGISKTQCVQFFSGCDKGADGSGNLAAPAINGVYFVEGQTYHVTIGYNLIDADTVSTYVSIDGNVVADNQQFDLTKTHDKYGNFSSYSSYMDTIAFVKEQAGGTVTISNPGQDMTAETHKLVLKDGADINHEILTNSYVLPTPNPIEYDKAGYVFIGWTDDTDNVTNLYPAGYELTLSEDTTLYPVWMKFKMRNGAGVRLADNSGIRFIVDTDREFYNAGVTAGKILEIGTILAPTDFLTNAELTHELGEGRFIALKTENWQEKSPNTYSAAFVNISGDQYARSFSARGYMKIQYTSGEGYIYTAYDANEHSRSIYEVATAAYNDEENPQYQSNDYIKNYVNKVADITVSNDWSVAKDTNAVGNYEVTTSSNSGGMIKVTVDKTVEGALINGVYVPFEKEATIFIGDTSYTLSGYELQKGKVTFEFVMTEGNTEDAKEYYLSVLQSYVDSTAYTVEHKEVVKDLAQTAIDDINNAASGWQDIFTEAITELETVKTAAELAANNTGDVELDAPVLSKGLGYTVTWNAVANADYYTISDDNDYRERVVVMANEPLSYKAEVVGKHNVKVTAHSYYEEYNSSSASNQVATPEVKPVFAYKSMLDGLYKFSSDQMSTMGISTTGCYYDSSDKMYFVYYNKDKGWSPNGAMATDWTSPAEFPAHAQRLKDMGNNILLIAYDTKASYKEDETWAASRMRYVMDTAWSKGMKVLVCDEVFYDLSMSDNSGTGATSKAQVTEAINARDGFAEYVTHPAFYGFSLDDEPYGKYISAMSYTISALDEACANLGVEDPFYLACLFQAQGGEFGKEMYLTQSSLESYYNKWLAIDGVDSKYLYVDIYTQHAMDQPTNRYNTSFEVVYDDSYLGGKYQFYQAITAHTQNDGVLLEQDLYMSLLYAAAHDVAGYSWFCYFPITGELAGTMVGYDGNGYGNGIGNNVEKGKSFYNAAKTAGYQFELLQGLLDGYDWKTRSHSDSNNLLTTTLSNGTNTATMYVNADVDGMSGSVTVTASGSQCYLIGYGVGTADAPYQAVSGSVTLAPGQAVICIN